jgi:hypothetical protein
MDPHTAQLIDLAETTQHIDPTASLFGIPSVRSFLLSLPPGHPDPLGQLREHFADRADVIELIEAGIALTALRASAAAMAADGLNTIAKDN